MMLATRLLQLSVVKLGCKMDRLKVAETNIVDWPPSKRMLRQHIHTAAFVTAFIGILPLHHPQLNKPGLSLFLLSLGVATYI